MLLLQQKEQHQSCYKKSDHEACANCFLAKFALPSYIRLQKCLFSLNHCKKPHQKGAPLSNRQEMYSIRMEKKNLVCWIL